MRIDYSEPKRAPISNGAANRPRKESSGLFTSVVAIAVMVAFGTGFGTGWFMSQRAAKKAFKAAMEQKSLENSPQPPHPQSPSQTAAAAASPQQASTAAPANATSPPPLAGQAEAPLSFYKTLPSGQKSAVLGSGINAREQKDEKAKQPLQAAIPANVTKPATAAATPDKPAPAAEKPAAKSEHGGFSVQVASYSLKSEAETVRSKLAGKGYNAYINESNQGDKGTWYRVRVGRKLESEAAKELAGKLGKGAIVIPDKE